MEDGLYFCLRIEVLPGMQNIHCHVTKPPARGKVGFAEIAPKLPVPAHWPVQAQAVSPAMLLRCSTDALLMLYCTVLSLSWTMLLLIDGQGGKKKKRKRKWQPDRLTRMPTFPPFNLRSIHLPWPPLGPSWLTPTSTDG
jgi:hypothetical protein